MVDENLCCPCDGVLDVLDVLDVLWV
jgi:hypothetical protein